MRKKEQIQAREMEAPGIFRTKHFKFKQQCNVIVTLIFPYCSL